VVKIVVSEGYSKTDSDQIVAAFGNVLRPEVKISVELVGDIARTATGKHPFVVSKVSLEV